MGGLEVQHDSRASTAKLSGKSNEEDTKLLPVEVDDIKMDHDSLASTKSLKSLELDKEISPQESLIEPDKDVPVSAIPVERQGSSTEEDEKIKEEKEQKSPLTVDLPPEEKEAANNANPEPDAHYVPTPMPPADSPRLQGSPEAVHSPVQEPQVEAKTTSPQQSEHITQETTGEALTIQDDLGKTVPTPPGSPGVDRDDSAISSSSISPDKLNEQLSDPSLEERQHTPVIEVA